MAESHDSPRDLTWYQNRWEELMDFFPASADPEEVIEQVRALQVDVLDQEAEALEEMGLSDAEEAKTVLQRTFERLQTLRRENQSFRHLLDTLDADSPSEAADSIEELHRRVQTLEEQHAALTDAGFDHPQHVLQALSSMEQQLDELYGEKQATERSPSKTLLNEDGDTFEQLQALMAREEKLQRELGVSSPEAVIEMVEDLTDQLEDLYLDRDADASANSLFSPAPVGPQIDETLEDELGVSDPEALVTMVTDLQNQLDELYADRQRLAEHGLSGTDDAIKMVQSMQHQLESLYERQEQMSEHGINGIDHALSMIESMERQLSELYRERHHLAKQGVETPDDLASHLEELEEQRAALVEEKESLREKRDRLQNQLDELERQIGLDDPAAISNLVDSLEAQLHEVYEKQVEAPREPSAPPIEPLLSNEQLAELEDLNADALSSLSAGIFCVDDRGVIRRANENALQWPDADVNTPDALVGKHFFDDVAPAANNALFRGRFEDGVAGQAMDDQFFYTYVSEDFGPVNLTVHLHRKPDQPVNWILFRIV